MWKEYYIQLWEKVIVETRGTANTVWTLSKILKLKQMKNYFIHILKQNEIILKIK